MANRRPRPKHSKEPMRTEKNTFFVTNQENTQKMRGNERGIEVVSRQIEFITEKKIKRKKK